MAMNRTTHPIADQVGVEVAGLPARCRVVHGMRLPGEKVVGPLPTPLTPISFGRVPPAREVSVELWSATTYATGKRATLRFGPIKPTVPRPRISSTGLFG